MKDNNPPPAAFTGLLTFTPTLRPTDTPGLAVEPLVVKLTAASIQVNEASKAGNPALNAALRRG